MCTFQTYILSLCLYNILAGHNIIWSPFLSWGLCRYLLVSSIEYFCENVLDLLAFPPNISLFWLWFLNDSLFLYSTSNRTYLLVLISFCICLELMMSDFNLEAQSSLHFESFLNFYFYLFIYFSHVALILFLRDMN